MSTLPPPPPPTQDSVPTDVGTLRVFFLVSLIVNAIATIGWLVSTLVGGLATCGVGCLLIILPVTSGIALALDAMALSKLNLRPDPGIAAFLQTAAIFDIIAGAVTVSTVPLVMGILVLVYLQKPELRRYYYGSAAGNQYG